MTLTKEEIRNRNIKRYYILFDGCNDDKLGRFETLDDVVEYARIYDEECDGEWNPLLFIYDRDTKKMEFFDEWNY